MYPLNLILSINVSARSLQMETPIKIRMTGWRIDEPANLWKEGGHGGGHSGLSCKRMTRWWIDEPLILRRGGGGDLGCKQLKDWWIDLPATRWKEVIITVVVVVVVV